MRRVIVFIAVWWISLPCSANILLPKIFGDNMVLQRNKPITIWGYAESNERVTVQFRQQTRKTRADKSGKWVVVFSPEEAGGPFDLTLTGKNNIVLRNVLVGEVWICSGQSNMEWNVRNTRNAEVEIANAKYPQIRQFLVPKTIASSPKDDFPGGTWSTCEPENVGNFTAVGYFFARELFTELNVPIGLVNTSWGGTHSETWTSRDAFEQSEEFREMIAGMPALDLDALAKERHTVLMHKLRDMNISLPAKNVDQWKNGDYNDNAWSVMTLPNLWEQQGLDGVDGQVWYRKTIHIDAADAGKDAMLSLAMIDDSDETFVNGIKVGATINQYNQQRSYPVRSGILKTGSNVIAIRVDDTGGGGGVYGKPEDLKLSFAGGSTLSLAGEWKYAVENVAMSNNTVGPNSYPTLLFNAMIHPILKLGIRGAIWYQGESNAGRAYQYRKAFPLMITDWRNHWGQGDFPFYYVQLASFDANHGNSAIGSSWAELREAQAMTLALPNTGMAVTIDIGEATDIHPRNKQDVGKRLAAIALRRDYGKNTVFSGPTFSGMKVDGDKIRVSFDNLGGGLLVRDKYGYLKGFEVAGNDQKFHYAKAWVDGNEVVVSTTLVGDPVAVRYAWADNPEDANLYNKEGFPAAPFRSDTWEGITLDAKFRIE
jgi:sialate O-acetylesterase